MKVVTILCNSKRCKLKNDCRRYLDDKLEDNLRYDKDTCYWFADKKEYVIKTAQNSDRGGYE